MFAQEFDKVIQLKDDIIKNCFKYQNPDISLRIYDWLSFQKLDFEISKYIKDPLFMQFVNKRTTDEEPLDMKELDLILEHFKDKKDFASYEKMLIDAITCNLEVGDRDQKFKFMKLDGRVKMMNHLLNYYDN